MRIDNYLNHTLLIATPSLTDPIFERSVVYIYEHNDEGALGVIINQPLSLKLKKILDHLELETPYEEVANHDVLMGGPLGQENGFVLSHEPKNGLVINSSKEILIQISQTKQNKPFLITLGYAAWQAGQLEQELLQDDWLIAPADDALLFDTPYSQRWHTAAELIGVDFNTYTGVTGNA